MSDEAAFLEAIRAAPADPTPRLVYADWLDERGDPRGEFLRLQQQIAEDLSWLERLQTNFDPTWLSAVAVTYDVIVDEIDPTQKIAFIKLVRAFTGVGLAEASAASWSPLPVVIVPDVPLNRAFEVSLAFRSCARTRIERATEPKA